MSRHPVLNSYVREAIENAKDWFLKVLQPFQVKKIFYLIFLSCRIKWIGCQWAFSQSNKKFLRLLPIIVLFSCLILIIEIQLWNVKQARCDIRFYTRSTFRSNEVLHSSHPKFQPPFSSLRYSTHLIIYYAITFLLVFRLYFHNRGA